MTADAPLDLFDAWLAEAAASEPNDPNAMTIATADADGAPDARMVLLKGVERAAGNDGFVFYTNLESAKGEQLAANPRAAAVFHWKSLRRQVRVRGPITAVSAADADAYYASRARGSRIGAWASRQSRELESRFALEAEVARYTARFGVGEIPRPDHWSGFRLAPLRIEFWRDRPFRLHERRVFERADVTAAQWREFALFP